MVKQSSKDQPPTPAQTATPPPVDQYRRTIDQDWAISILMEVQKNVAAHDVTLAHVSTDVGELKRTVGRVEKVIYAAAAVVAIAGGFLVWSVNTAKDIYLATHAAPTEQRSLASPASQIPPDIREKNP